MTATERARNVCRVCITRKKACDKSLPACGFCASRGLHCSYDTPAQKKNGQRRHNPGRHFVALRSPSPPILHIRSLHVPRMSLGGSHNAPAQLLFEFTHAISHDIIARYFTGFHTSYPVVSPDSLCQELSLYQEEGRLPPADLTVLLLAMLMIISPPLSPSILPPGITQEYLYTTTKVALSQAQAFMSTSVRLVQTAVLIALREYTSGRVDAAYISLMGCVGMARLSGISTATIRRTGDQGTAGGPRADTQERENVAWAIAMLERLILCEIDQPNLTPQTEYPGSEYILPSDLRPTAGLYYKSNTNPARMHKATFLGPHATAGPAFGTQARVVSLLDRLLTALRHTDADAETDAKLAGLDREIQHSLKTILSDWDWQRDLHCVPAAMCVRQLLMLHASVLDARPHPRSEDRRRVDIASLGLNSACRIVLDVLESERDREGLLMPICCFYSIRDARRSIQGRNGFRADERLAREVETLLGAERQYSETWTFQGLPSG